MPIPSQYLFLNNCAGCKKIIKTPANNRQGDLPTVYCNSVCETNYRNKKRFANEKEIVSYKKGLSTEQIAKRVSRAPWEIGDWEKYYKKQEIKL